MIIKSNIIFSVITYRPNSEKLKKLLAVLKPYKSLIIDNSKNNLGYAGGANKAIKALLRPAGRDFAGQADWIVILNQNLTVTSAFLHKFVSHLKTSQPAILGPFVGALDKKRWTTILPITPSCHSRENGNLFKWIPAYAWMTSYISGSFLAIHKKVIEKIGYFYQPYFMYYEDADYCIRAQKAGFPITRVKIPGISHRDAAPSFSHEYYLARNHLLFVKRNAPFSVKFHEILRFPKTIYEHLKNKNYGALKGILDFFLRKIWTIPILSFPI